MLKQNIGVKYFVQIWQKVFSTTQGRIIFRHKSLASIISQGSIREEKLVGDVYQEIIAREAGGRWLSQLRAGADSTKAAGSIPAWAPVSCALLKKNYCKGLANVIVGPAEQVQNPQRRCQEGQAGTSQAWAGDAAHQGNFFSREISGLPLRPFNDWIRPTQTTEDNLLPYSQSADDELESYLQNTFQPHRGQCQFAKLGTEAQTS